MKQKRKYTKREPSVKPIVTLGIKKNQVDKKEEQIIKSSLVYGVEGKFLHVKVGDKDRPADQSDIDLITGQMEELLEKYKVRCLVFVTHHAVDINVIGGEGSTVPEVIKREEVADNEQSKKGNI